MRNLSCFFEIFALRFSAALGNMSKSLLHSLARKFGCARQYEQVLLHSLARKFFVYSLTCLLTRTYSDELI